MADVIPEGLVPLEQFQATNGTVTPQDMPAVPQAGTPDGAIPPGLVPLEQFPTQESTYGTPSQKAGAFAEGFARGVVPGVVPWAEAHLGEVPYEEQAGRERENPITSKVGEFTGFVAPAVFSLGARAMLKAGQISAGTYMGLKAAEQGTVAGLAERAGKLATDAIGLSAPSGYAAKVGSAMVKNAAEMAVIQGADDSARMAYDEEAADAGVEHAIANMGLSAALGAGTGGILTGAVSPLWNATHGLGLSKFMKAVKFTTNHNADKVAQKAVSSTAKIIEDGLPHNFSSISSQIQNNFDPARHAALAQDLQDAGFKITPGIGNYTDQAGVSRPEPMFHVEHNGSSASKAKLDALAKKYSQESVIHSDALPGVRINELRFTDPNTPAVKGMGVDMNPKLQQDFTELPGIGRYQLGLDFDGKHRVDLDKLVKNIAKKPKAKAIKMIGQEAGDWAADDFAHDQYESLDDPESALNAAIKVFGDKVNVPNYMTAAMHGEPRAIQYLNDLREMQHPDVIKGFQELPKQVQSGLAEKLNVNPEDLMHYSDAEDGHQLRRIFQSEYNTAYDPVAKEMEKRDANAAGLSLPPQLGANVSDSIIQKGMDDVGSRSPFFKNYEQYANRVKGAESMKELYQIKSELRSSARSMSENLNAKRGYNNMAQIIDDGIERELAQEEHLISNEGTMNASDFITQKRAANLRYMNFSKMSNELADHLDLPEFRGAKAFKEAQNALSPEQIVKKFSPKGNVDSIPFLQKYFPETAKYLQEIEMKKFLASAVKSDKGEAYLDTKMLGKKLASLKGAPEYANFVMKPEHQEALQAANTILDHVPGIKSSGTAGWASRLLNHFPGSVTSTIAYMMGHNPVSAYVMEHLSNYLGREVPMAAKMAFLKALGSNAPEDAAALKAATTMMKNTMRGHQRIMNAASYAFKPGTTLMVASQGDQHKNREKLDKMIDDVQANPSMLATYTTPKSGIGTIMPNHEAALQKATTAQLTYLAGLKPKPLQVSPFEKPRDPSKSDMDRYYQAVDIANDPMSVAKRVKDGTVSVNDRLDLQHLYPEVYQSLSKEYMNYATALAQSSNSIPYSTKIGLSTFLGVPMDSSMQPQSILSAQKTFAKPPPNQAPVNPKRGTQTLGKSNKTYRTPSQAAEADRSGGRGE